MLLSAEVLFQTTTLAHLSLKAPRPTCFGNTAIQSMGTTQFNFKHTGNKQKTAINTVHLLPQVIAIYILHFKNSFLFWRITANVVSQDIPRHHECLNSKSAQQAAFEQLAFRQATKQPKYQLFLPPWVLKKQQEHLNSDHICMQTGIAGMLF